MFKKIIKAEDSLQYKSPKLAKEWHPTKNGSLSPLYVSTGSKKRAWWKCPKGIDHEWDATIVSRYAGAGCPICSGARIVRSNSLARTNPKLAKEWDIIKNGDLTPFDVGEGSKTSVWWRCPDKGHSYMYPVIKRRQLSSCLVCDGKIVSENSNLKILRPDLYKYWHPTKNIGLDAEKLLPRSKKIIWWKCPEGDDHEWQDSIKKTSLRKKPFWCPMCNYVKIIESNCLNTTYPEIAKEWHPTKNGELTPKNVSHGMKKKVWWKCPKGDDHEWQDSISNRTKKGKKCKICTGKVLVYSNSLKAVYPEFAKEWHPIKNGSLKPEKILYKDSVKKIWWKCPKEDDHEWQSTLELRVRHKRCPFCRGKKLSKSNSLAIANPEIAKEWHPTKNGDLTPYDVRSADYTKKVWWKCPKGDDHEWQISIGKRTYSKKPRGCPMCSGAILVRSNSLGGLYPEIAKEWHPTKNGSLTPFDIGKAVSTKVWWKCPKGDDHEWKASVSTRTIGGAACGVCSSTVIVKSNCLATLEPELTKEWHPTKNGKLTPWKVSKGGTQKVWWKCSKNANHEWQSVIAARTSSGKTGCPYCTLTPQSEQELIISFELSSIFNGINPKGYKANLKGKLRAIDIYIPELRLAIEFDGAYWHKDKRAIDKIKTEMLLEKGHKVIRVREEPLDKIFENDIISGIPYNGKEVTNNILKRIKELYNLNKEKIEVIDKYLNKRKLQNKEALSKYIEKLLKKNTKQINLF